MSANTPSAELLPCPFCGSSAAHGTIDDESSDDFGGHFVSCTKCGACSVLRFPCGDDPKPLVIDAWNTRAELTAATPAPDAVGDAVRALAHEAKEWAQELDYFQDITHRLAVPELRIFMRRVAALADKAQSAGDEQEGV